MFCLEHNPLLQVARHTITIIPAMPASSPSGAQCQDVMAEIFPLPPRPTQKQLKITPSPLPAVVPGFFLFPINGTVTNTYNRK